MQIDRTKVIEENKKKRGICYSATTYMLPSVPTRIERE